MIITPFHILAIDIGLILVRCPPFWILPGENFISNVSLSDIKRVIVEEGPKDVIVEDVIQSPAKSEEELLEIIRQLESPEFKKKLINLLSTLGGNKVGDPVRKMLRVLGTNGLWSNYSLKGKKKKNFSELSLCRVVTKSCIKIHRCSVSGVEECIAETLKHAPAQKDGPRYKKRPETNTNQPADQRAENNNLE
ncbi:unnamed protein product [Mytilus coruscus]|uniref:Uncharacterized protein n=1 Tax=Mytilus coruscus TaxID=42192 RepID=A0A6J8BTJ6_MYTCO|nr:unnamed protein product [Mytilus coruscus]